VAAQNWRVDCNLQFHVYGEFNPQISHFSAKDPTQCVIVTTGVPAKLHLHRAPQKTSRTLSIVTRQKHPILIILGKFILGTTGHQMTIQNSTSTSVCFCITWGKQNPQSVS